MSVRAYRITKIEFENSPTFNLWHDDFIVDNLNLQLDEAGGGLVVVNKEDIDRLDEEFKKQIDSFKKEDKENYQNIITDLKSMITDEMDYIEFMCF